MAVNAWHKVILIYIFNYSSILEVILWKLFLGNSFYCQCLPSYSGQRCENRDPCANNPCVNGNCIAQGSNYICQCKPGYTGQRCETCDPCTPNP